MVLFDSAHELDIEPAQQIHTVVHTDTHAYIDTFLDKDEADDYVHNFEPHKGMWKIISKAVR